MSNKVFIIKTANEIYVSPIKEGGIGKYILTSHYIHRISGKGEISFITDITKIPEGIHEVNPDGIIEHKILFNEIWIKDNNTCQIRYVYNPEAILYIKRELEKQIEFLNYDETPYSDNRWVFGYEKFGVKFDKYGNLPMAHILKEEPAFLEVLENNIAVIGQIFKFIPDNWSLFTSDGTFIK